MTELIEIGQGAPLTAALAGVRVAALTWTAPLGGAWSWRIKLALTLAVSLLIAPTLRPVGWPGGAQAVAWMFREAAIGVALGLSMLLVLAAVRASGVLAAQASGLGLGGVRDDDADPLSRMVELTTAALLLASGGHRLVVAALLSTFAALPVAGDSALPWQELASLASTSFEFALRAAAPIVAAALAARLLMAMLARAQPTLRDAALSQSAATLAAVGMWLLTVGAAGLLARDHLHRLLEQLGDLLVG